MNEREKAVEQYMQTPIKDWPDGLKSFVDYQQKRLGICTEVIRGAIEQFYKHVPVGDEWEQDGFYGELLERDTELAALKARLDAAEARLSALDAEWRAQIIKELREAALAAKEDQP